jgi:SAM-dependent methyltransferase
VLELGCGPGYLWAKNTDRIPAGWQIALCDQSSGMVRQARRNLGPNANRFSFEAADAQRIPHCSGLFDAVVANHMLYHVPDKPIVFSEIRRVLKTGGSLFAATNGEDNMPELQGILGKMRQPDRETPTPSSFSLENGGEQLAAWFSAVTQHPFEDALDVTETGPLADYVLSVARDGAPMKELDRFIASVDAQIARHGSFHVSKAMGLFEARK